MPIRHFNGEAAANGGDILVEALGDLVALKGFGGAGQRYVDAFKKLSGQAVLLAVFDEEGLDG